MDVYLAGLRNDRLENVIENVGPSNVGVLAVLGTKSQDVSSSSVHILTFLF